MALLRGFTPPLGLPRLWGSPDQGPMAVKATPMGLYLHPRALLWPAEGFSKNRYDSMLYRGGGLQVTCGLKARRGPTEYIALIRAPLLPMPYAAATSKLLFHVRRWLEQQQLSQ